MVDCLFYITTWNQDRYLGKCLDSLIAQTNKNWKAIVYDDTSTDNTFGVCLGYSNEPRITFINGIHELGNAAKCLIEMFKENIESKYETKIDGDNEIRPNFIDTMCRGEGFNYSDFTFSQVGSKDTYVRVQDPDLTHLQETYYMGPSFCWKQSVRKAWKRPFPDTWAEDWNLALMCAEAGAEFKVIHSDVFFYRNYKGNASDRIIGDPREHEKLIRQVQELMRERRK